MWTFLIVSAVIQAAAWIVLTQVVWRKLKSKEEAVSQDAREEKLFKLYTEIESMLDSFEEYLQEVHEDAEKQREALTDMSRQATVMYQALENSRIAEQTVAAQMAVLQTVPAVVSQAAFTPQVQLAAVAPVEKSINIIRPQKETPSRLNQKERDELRRRTTKTQKVRFLMSRGFSLDEVAKELHIGKGEVRLITDLDKNA